MRYLILVPSLFLAACATQPCATAPRAALAVAGGSPCATASTLPTATYAVAGEIPVYAYGVGPNDHARATLAVPGRLAGCVATWASAVLTATAQGIECVGVNLVPPNPQASLYPGVVAPRAAPAALPAAAPCAPQPTTAPMRACPPPVSMTEDGGCVGTVCAAPVK